MSKPPAPQGISRLLANAGFEKSAMIDNSRYKHTAGYHVRARLGTVRVSWWPESGYSAAAHEAAIPVAREMMARYAEAIRAAGWAVDVKMHTLIVTAGEDTP